MQEHYQNRYLCENIIELAGRVARTLADNDSERELFDEIIRTRTFIPAGNTLLAGAADIAPNCCVLGRVDESNFREILELSKKLWRQRTGVGYDLSGLADPVAALRLLSAANNEIDLQHRPKRGNMATLEASHPRIREFIACKDDGVSMSNFNISVSVQSGCLDDALLQCIAEHAWSTGDPGLILLENAQSYGPVSAKDLPPIVTCVPCGEQFMHAGETCNLGSINLNSSALWEPGVGINEERLRPVVHAAVSLMDKVVDLLVFPDERLKRIALGARRIGLGVMGWADYLERLGFAYDSWEARGEATRLARLLSQFAEERSRQLAAELGPCEHSTEYRNLSMTCIAPTGGISGLTGNKGYAIEPFFSEAVDISPYAQVDMQAAWQSHMHNAVSKTVNLPNTASVQDIVEIYRYAIRKRVKGITVYRDGSKQLQPMALCPQCT